MILIDPKDIIVPENRFRREFDEKKLNELKESILSNGLMNPITVERTGDQFTLRAGERRLRVLRGIIEAGGTYTVGGLVQAGALVAAVEYGELTDIQRLAIEVEENVVRSDFTWQERDRAYAALHELRKKQDPSQSVTATATEILGKPARGGQVSSVADSIIIAKHLHVPEVAKAKSSKEALKVIQKISEAGQRVKLAAAAAADKTPHQLLKGDACVILPSLPAASFDVILTDPPYGVAADNFGDMASTGHDYEDSKKYFEELLKVFPDESYRVAKERAHAYVFCDVRNFERLATLMVLAGWTVFPTPLTWDKSPTGMLPFPDNGPRRCTESILYAWKGDRRSLQVKPDIIKVSAVKRLKVGAQKPVALYIDLLSRSANPGDAVLDCFGGSGPILVAANRLSLTATYVEKSEDAFNIAQMRVNIREIDDGAEEADGLGDISF